MLPDDLINIIKEYTKPYSEPLFRYKPDYILLDTSYSIEIQQSFVKIKTNFDKVMQEDFEYTTEIYGVFNQSNYFPMDSIMSEIHNELAIKETLVLKI